jgi:hypothetical protein
VDVDDRSVTEWRALCLARVRRFSRLALTPSVVGAPQLRHLTRRAVLSAYRDCAAAGVDAEARRVMAEAFEEMRLRAPGGPAAA